VRSFIAPASSSFGVDSRSLGWLARRPTLPQSSLPWHQRQSFRVSPDLPALSTGNSSQSGARKGVPEQMRLLIAMGVRVHDNLLRLVATPTTLIPVFFFRGILTSAGHLPAVPEGRLELGQRQILLPLGLNNTSATPAHP
jgi:hypothetical protein